MFMTNVDVLQGRIGVSGMVGACVPGVARNAVYPMSYIWDVPNTHMVQACTCGPH